MERSCRKSGATQDAVAQAAYYHNTMLPYIVQQDVQQKNMFCTESKYREYQQKNPLPFTLLPFSFRFP